jgi:hypothetical protein
MACIRLCRSPFDYTDTLAAESVQKSTQIFSGENFAAREASPRGSKIKQADERGIFCC